MNAFIETLDERDVYFVYRVGNSFCSKAKNAVLLRSETDVWPMETSFFVGPTCGSSRTNLANAWDNLLFRCDFPMQGFSQSTGHPVWKNTGMNERYAIV